MGKLGSYNEAVEPEHAALFLYILSASQGTRFVFDAAMHEPELVSTKGTRFVADLALLLNDPEELSKVKKVVIGSSVSIIEYKDRYKELYTLADDQELESYEVFDRDFLKNLATNLTVFKPVVEQ